MEAEINLLPDNIEPEDNTDLSSSYSDNFPGILKALGISLAITSYQSGRVILLRTSDGHNLDTRFKVFPRPMGIFADSKRLSIATLTQVVDFKNNPNLLTSIKSGGLDNEEKFSKKLSEKDKVLEEELIKKKQAEVIDIKAADSLYLERASLTTGTINIHDIAWGDEGLWVVNSTFSCLATLSPERSFIARWKPEFITELVPEDRCHLNGMAMLNGKPKYVTTFNTENSADSWSKDAISNGTMIDIDTNEILIEGLILPHSPKVHNEQVYVCESGYGRVWKFCPETKTKSEFVTLPGFTRGLYFYGDLMFVGTSKLRESDTGVSLPIRNQTLETLAGIWIINMQTREVIAHVVFEGDITQIYDIAIIPDSSMPEILNSHNTVTRFLFDFEEQLI